MIPAANDPAGRMPAGVCSVGCVEGGELAFQEVNTCVQGLEMASGAVTEVCAAG